MDSKAVVLGSNYYIGLSAIRCLGVKGVYTAAVDYSGRYRYGAQSKYCREKLISPNHRQNPGAFIDFLKDYAAKQDFPPVLIPCHDSYVEIVDTHLDELKEYYLIPQTEAGLCARLLNKAVLHRLAMGKGIAVPEMVRVDEENFLEKVEDTIKYPCLVKPTDSASFTAYFRRKMFVAKNRGELEKAVADARGTGYEVFVQRIIPGFDDHMYTFDAYLDQGSKVTHWATFQKYRQYPINYGASVYVGQKHVPELHRIGTEFLEAIKYKGFAEIEFKKDAQTGQFYLIEVNVRITNFNNLLYRLGLNMPYITYCELTGVPLEPKAITEDTNMVFWCAYEDFLAIRGYLKTRQLTLREILVSLFRPKVYAVWDWTDMGPTWAFYKMLGTKLCNKLTGRKVH